MHQKISAALPDAWTAELTRAQEKHSEATLSIRSPDGVQANLPVALRRTVEGRDVPVLSERLGRGDGAEPAPEGVLIVSRFLSSAVRNRLAHSQLSYADTTGNLRVSLTAPALFLGDRGADTDPWRRPGRPRGTLKGAPASKVTRALIEVDGPWTVRELVSASRASTGSTYRVIEFLESEGLLSRTDDKRVIVPDWTALLRRWSADYGFILSNTITRWIAPRGLDALFSRIGERSGMQYAVTGTAAAAQWAPYAPSRSAMIYVADAAECAQAWDLRPADSGVNVLLAEPESDVVFDRTVEDGRLTMAAPAQVAVDLLTGPGRAPSEAEELIQWMRTNERSWRHG